MKTSFCTVATLLLICTTISTISKNEICNSFKCAGKKLNFMFIYTLLMHPDFGHVGTLYPEDFCFNLPSVRERCRSEVKEWFTLKPYNYLYPWFSFQKKHDKLITVSFTDYSLPFFKNGWPLLFHYAPFNSVANFQCEIRQTAVTNVMLKKKSLQQEMWINSTKKSADIILFHPVESQDIISILCHNSLSHSVLWKTSFHTSKILEKLELLKSIGPPGAVANLNLKALSYFGEYKTDFVLGWNGVTKWNSEPKFAEVACVILTKRIAERRMPLQTKCFTQQTLKGCERCWNLSHIIAGYSRDQTGIIYQLHQEKWPKTETIFHIKNPESPFKLSIANNSAALKKWGFEKDSILLGTILGSISVCRARAIAFAGVGDWSDTVIFKIGRQHKRRPALLIKQTVFNVTEKFILEKSVSQPGIVWNMVRRLHSNSNASRAGASVSILDPTTTDLTTNEKEYLGNIATQFVRIDMTSGVIQDPINVYSVSPLVYQGFNNLEVLHRFYEDASCYDWIGKRLFRAQEKANGTFTLTHTDMAGDFNSLWWNTKTWVLLDNLPKISTVHCLFMSSDILWTNEESDGFYSLNGITYSPAPASDELTYVPIGNSSECNDVNRLDSPKLAVLSLNQFEILIVLINGSIQAVDIRSCFFKELLTAEYLNSIHICKIRAIAVNSNCTVVHDSCNKIAVFDIIWHLNGKQNQFVNYVEALRAEIISYNFVYDIRKIDRNLSIEEAESFDNYPSYIAHEHSMNDSIADLYLDNSLSHGPPLLVDCLYPIVTEVQPKMLSKTAAAVIVKAKWDTVGNCKFTSKPALVYKLQYLKAKPESLKLPDQLEGLGSFISESAKNHFEQSPCSFLKENRNFFDCRQKSVGPIRLLTAEFALDNLEHNTSYRIEISVEPDINEDMMEKYWFPDDLEYILRTRKGTGSPHHQWVGRQPTGMHFQSLYSPKTIDIKRIVGMYVSGGVILTMLVSGAFLFYLMKRRKRIFADLERIKISQLKLFEKTLGHGHFGIVKKGQLQLVNGSTMAVAVKVLKPSAPESARSQLLEEAMILGKLKGHANIVMACGICLDTNPRMLVLEYINGGSLLDFLHNQKNRNEVKVKELLRIALGINSACIILEEKGYIHRDISAKNVLMQGNVPKLADFGLAKDVVDFYQPLAGFEFPIPWTAPEGFKGHFTIKSDVWSFGVILYEMFSWGATPYGLCGLEARFHLCPMQEFSKQEIETHVCRKRKSLNDLPDPCSASFPQSVRELMKLCWQYVGAQRPTFKKLKTYIEGTEKCGQNMQGFGPSGLMSHDGATERLVEADCSAAIILQGASHHCSPTTTSEVESTELSSAAIWKPGLSTSRAAGAGALEPHYGAPSAGAGALEPHYGPPSAGAGALEPHYGPPSAGAGALEPHYGAPSTAAGARAPEPHNGAPSTAAGDGSLEPHYSVSPLLRQ